MYGTAFYAKIRSGCQASAQAVAPLVHEIVKPSTVVDVGCGEGWWGQAFADLGANAVGIETGDTAQPAPNVAVLDHDLREPLPDLGRYDLAVCLEVAEHLPAERASGLIADLCALAPVVLFSAAVPGQGGTGHVNCQWPAYWHALFAAEGWSVDWSLRFLIWDDERVEPWYRQNLALAFDQAHRPEIQASLEHYCRQRPLPLAVRHPDVWVTR